jgi:hypothetical protein
VGPVEAYPADVLQARQQPEAEQVREGEADGQRYVDTFPPYRQTEAV